MTLEELKSLRDPKSLDPAVRAACKKLRMALMGVCYPQCYPTRSYGEGNWKDRPILQDHLRWQFHRRPGKWVGDTSSMFDLLAPKVMAARLTNSPPDIDKLTLEFATLVARVAMKTPHLSLSVDRDAIITIQRYPENFPSLQ